MDNLFGLERSLIDRLQPLIGTDGLRAVMGARDLAGVMATRQEVPAAYILYAGDTPVTASQDCQRLRQYWLVVLVVRAGRERNQQCALAEPGVMLARISQQLQGWRPDDITPPLLRDRSPPPQHEDGMSYYPIVYTTEIILHQE